MDPFSGHHDEAVRDEKARFLRGVRTLRRPDVVRGQYRGYRDTDGVHPSSTVETYAAIRLHVDTWRWSGVPIIVRAGKCLPLKATEIIVELKRPPEKLFPTLHPHGNRLRFQIEPEVVIGLEVQSRKPGLEQLAVEDVELTAMRQAAHNLPPYQRPAERGTARRARSVREPGDNRGGVADRRSDPRRRHPGSRVRARLVGSGRGRPARPRARVVPPAHQPRSWRMIRRTLGASRESSSTCLPRKG